MVERRGDGLDKQRQREGKIREAGKRGRTNGYEWNDGGKGENRVRKGKHRVRNGKK